MADLETTTPRAAAPEHQSGPANKPGRRRVVLGVIAALIVFFAGWWIGARINESDGEPTASTAGVEMPVAVDAWADAWMDRDAEAFALLYEPDGIFHGVLAVAFEGRDEIRANMGDYWGPGTPEQFEPDYVYADGSGAVVVWNVTSFGEDGTPSVEQRVTTFEWAWDDPELLRSTNINW